MRPLELSISNFRSYHGDATVFDFRGRRLTGIVGPIGSGKSSILDAVAFALYGRTPTIAGATRSLIHQRSDSATVGLRFEVDGEVWQVVRSLRRKGQSQHALMKLASDVDDAEELERVVLESEVTSRVVELLGLEFDAFSRSVLLAQGRFAEFLSAQPADRDKVLKGVFGHERIDAMRDVAREHGRLAESDLGRLSGRLDQLGRVAVRLAENEEAITVIDERVERLRKAEQAFVDLEERRANARRAESAAKDRLADLNANAGKLPEPAAAGSWLSEAADAAARRIAHGARLDEAQNAVVEAEAALEAAERSGMQRVIDDAADLIARRAPVATRASDIDVKLDDLISRARTAGASAEAATSAEQQAETVMEASARTAAAAAARLRDAEADARAARHLEMADALRSGLEPGHTCPVCEQTVTVVPAPGGSALASAERSLDDANAAAVSAAEESAAASEAHATAREIATKATMHADAVQGELAAWRQQRLEAVADLDTIDRQLEAALGHGDPIQLLEAARSKLRALNATASEARKAAERARSAHDEAIVAEQSAGKQVSELRLAVTDLAARLGISVPMGDGVDDVGRALGELAALWSETLEALQSDIESRAAEIASIESEKRDLEADLAIDRDIASDLGAANAKAEMIRAQIETDREEIEAASELTNERDRLAALLAGYERIAGDLTNAGFIRFLLDDERARLSDLGSEHFQRLSSGRYRFTEDGRFDVIDLTAADAVRKADSLSGGETFVASLALALALAEMVSGIGGRLDAFFIDEGFGSLDPEHLDLAMEGVESLAAGDASRLVVVVSHVPELRQRIEDLIELDRDPVTGDTRVVRGLAAS